jgi:protein tyrosine phosphatase (PTP) superfamily phosphohydrolase (DUF442 family)
MTRICWISALVLTVGLVGCAHKQQQVPCNGCGPGTVPPGAIPPGQLPPGARVVPGPNQPPPGAFLPGTPGDPNTPTQPGFNPSSRPQPIQGQVRLPDDLFAPGSVQQSTWRPSTESPSVRLSPPDPANGGQAPSVRIGTPIRDEPPLADVQPGERKDDPRTQITAPIDIPDFVVLRPGIALGRQPFPDGVAWLQAQGYRTVLHVREPEATDTAAQRVFENRRLKYVSVSVSTSALNRQTVDAFNRLLADASAQPLFVFDRDGSLVPGMVYLYFRTAGGLTQDQALTEAARIGFRPASDPSHRAFLQAANAYLTGQ